MEEVIIILLLVLTTISIGDKQAFTVPASSVDFSGCKVLDDGRCCITKTRSYPTPSKQAVLECRHRNITSCHYTYITEFKPYQESVCSDSYQKKCRITYQQRSVVEKVVTCHTPLPSLCGGGDTCRTYHETACTTTYKEKGQGKVLGQTSCQRIPRVLCGDPCKEEVEEAAEECFDEDINTVMDTPEESCDLTPIKTCHKVTKLAPVLTPKKECTIVPHEVCTAGNDDTLAIVDKTVDTIWCKEADKDTVGGDDDDDSDNGGDDGNNSNVGKGDDNGDGENVDKGGEKRRGKAIKTDKEVTSTKTLQALSKLPPIKKTVGIGSAFVFPRKSFKDKESATKDLISEQPRKEVISRKGSNRSYLPLPGAAITQRKNNQLVLGNNRKVGKTNLGSALHTLVPPAFSKLPPNKEKRKFGNNSKTGQRQSNQAERSKKTRTRNQANLKNHQKGRKIIKQLPRQGKSYSNTKKKEPESNSRKDSLDIERGLNSKHMETEISKYLPTKQPKKYSETKQPKKLKEEDDLPFYSLSDTSKFSTAVRPAPGGLAALAVLSQSS